jgi:hypothetical protein
MLEQQVPHNCLCGRAYQLKDYRDRPSLDDSDDCVARSEFKGPWSGIGNWEDLDEKKQS